MQNNATAFFVDRHVENGNADRLAIVSGNRRITYSDLAANVRQVAGFLKESGVRPEERVLVLLNDTPEFVYFFFGALRIGAVAVPINTFCDAEYLAFFIENTRAGVVVTHEGHREKLEKALVLAAKPNVRLHFVEEKKWEKCAPEFDIYPVDRDDTAFWLYTSGSTGRPKAAMHRHAGMVACADTYSKSVLGIRPDDLCFSTSKLFFAYGLGNSLIFPFSVGAACVLNEKRVDVENIKSLIESHRPTLFFSVPGVYRQMLASPEINSELFSGVRMCISAGEYLPAQLFESWWKKTGQPIYDGIGSTEAMHIFCSNTMSAYRAGTSGLPVPGYDLRIMDENGMAIDDDRPGCLYVKGETVAKGYWNRFESTRESFQGEWLSTGDIYQRTKDGFYRYIGRQGDTFKSSGLWVSSTEIEEVLLAHPELREAGVIAVQNEEGAFVAKAFVSPKKPDEINEEALKESISEFLAGRLSKYKIPSEMVILPELPKTATGKIARGELRAILG